MIKDKEKRKLYDKQRYEANKERIKEQHKIYYENNKEKNKETNKEYQKEYHEKNKDIVNKKHREYYQENKTIIKKYTAKYQKKQREINSLFKLRQNISTLIRQSITRNGFKKTSKSAEILGCTFEEFNSHIESKWESWMNWNNYGNPKDGVLEPNKTWDIDHIIPLSSATCEADIIKLNHFTNLQPLCSYTNRKIKRNNIPTN